MRTRKGTDRIALVGERYTFKLARSNPWLFLKVAKETESSFRQSKARGMELDELKKYRSVILQHGLSQHLLRGVIANKRERRLAEAGGVVLPTISLPGSLVNVQPTAQGTGLDFHAVHSIFADYLGPEVTKLGHMLEDTDNLGVINDHVVFVDGGSQGLERLMQSHEDSIRQALGALSLIRAN